MLRHGFLEAVLRGARVTRSSLFLSEDRSSEKLPHLPRISLIMICGRCGGYPPPAHVPPDDLGNNVGRLGHRRHLVC